MSKLVQVCPDCLSADCPHPWDGSCLKNLAVQKAEAPPSVDLINHPPHYESLGLEPIEVIEKWNLPYHLGNALKYIARAGKKYNNPMLQDLKKARWYLDRYIELIEKER